MAIYLSAGRSLHRVKVSAEAGAVCDECGPLPGTLKHKKRKVVRVRVRMGGHPVALICEACAVKLQAGRVAQVEAMNCPTCTEYLTGAPGKTLAQTFADHCEATQCSGEPPAKPTPQPAPLIKTAIAAAIDTPKEGGGYERNLIPCPACGVIGIHFCAGKRYLKTEYPPTLPGLADVVGGVNDGAELSRTPTTQEPKKRAYRTLPLLKQALDDSRGELAPDVRSLSVRESLDPGYGHDLRQVWDYIGDLQEKLEPFLAGQASMFDVEPEALPELPAEIGALLVVEAQTRSSDAGLSQLRAAVGGVRDWARRNFAPDSKRSVPYEELYLPENADRLAEFEAWKRKGGAA